MKRDLQKLRAFEDQLVAESKVDISHNFAVANALYEEARNLGILPLKDPLEGLEEKIEFIRILNAL